MSRLGLLSLLMLGGCSSLGLAPCNGNPDTASTVADLACWSGKGNKFAQYTLGRKYEQGDGVAINLKRARGLFAAAAAATPSTMYVYSPPIGKESYGRVIPITTGVAAPGLPEARIALERVLEKLK